jgi:hypothetical protein
MDAKQKILDKVAKLIAKGEAVSSSARRNAPGYHGPTTVDNTLFAEWQAQGVNLLSKVEGASGTYLKQFQAGVRRATLEDTQSGLGILRGFREDVEDDALQRVTDLVAAEVFDDFLTQADHLHGQGFHTAAASVGGAVLERDLRARCQARDIKVKSNDGISSLNQKLVSAQPQEYSAVTSKKIDTWGKMRNEADHGHFENVQPQDVADMLKGVREFVESHLP